MPAPTPDALYIGIDIGTSSVKATLGGPGIGEVDTYAASYPLSRPATGRAEQNPDDWLAHALQALGQFAARADADAVQAIGLTSQVNTHIFCDGRGLPLHPALTWQDTRSARSAARLESRIDESRKVTALGAPVPIDASHVLARMEWMAANEPGVWDATDHVLLPKDYVLARLTGVTVSDPLSNVGLVGPTLTYAAPLLDLVPRSHHLLPELADPLDLAGVMGPGHPFAGTPVAVGTMDAWASLFGLGVTEEGEAMYLAGTSEVLGLIANRGSGAPGVVTFADWRHRRLHAGPTQSGGASMHWLATLLGQDLAAVIALASPDHITTTSPLFLPHLEGERAPLWDPLSRGAFVGMTSATGPRELAACLMEGVAFAARLALEAVEASGQRVAASLCHGGGGARSDTWCQIRTNALGRPLERPRSANPGAAGALVMASLACGDMHSLREAAGCLVQRGRVFTPDPRHHPLGDERFQLYKDLYRSLRPVNLALADPGISTGSTGAPAETA